MIGRQVAKKEYTQAPSIVNLAPRRDSGRPLDKTTKLQMESRFGYDFSRVRIHDGTEAGETAAMIGASAYSIGENIVFVAGGYHPNTEAGMSLIAHELAHVVQQGLNTGPARPRISSAGGEDEVEADRAASDVMGGRRPNLGSARGVPQLQRKVATLGGEWETDTYDVVKDFSMGSPPGGKEIGLDVDLKFTPQAPAESTKIGLVQKANSIVGGKPIALTPTVKSRSIPSSEHDAGAHIDRLSAYGNPLYATDAPSATATLASTPTVGYWGQHGWRYKGPDGRIKEQDAHLKDKPTLPSAGKDSSQTFETTALAVEGTQSGTTYGSVQWGWQKDGSETFSKLPLSASSMGIPSASFRRAAELWNASKTSSGADVLKLPGMRAAQPAPGKEKDAVEAALKVKDYATAYMILNGQWMRPMLPTLASMRSELPRLYTGLVLDLAVGIDVPRVRSAIEAVQNKLDKIRLSAEFYDWMDPAKNPGAAADIKEINAYLGTP